MITSRIWNTGQLAENIVHHENAPQIKPSKSKTDDDLIAVPTVNGLTAKDLLDAQRTYLDAQISLSNAIRDRQITLVNLYKALGGGWEQ